MAYRRVTGWNEDVFAYNDYFHDKATGEALLRPPLPGLPYLITEAIGVDEAKPRRFSWTDPPGLLAKQAALHGEAQSLARSEPGYSGMLAWAAFDYASPEGLDPELLKYAGVVDSFRVPKLARPSTSRRWTRAYAQSSCPCSSGSPTGCFRSRRPS